MIPRSPQFCRKIYSPSCRSAAFYNEHIFIYPAGVVKERPLLIMAAGPLRLIARWIAEMLYPRNPPRRVNMLADFVQLPNDAQQQRRNHDQKNLDM